MGKKLVKGGPTSRGSTFRGDARCWLRFGFKYRLLQEDKMVAGGPLDIGIQVHEAFAQHFAHKLRPDVDWASPESRLKAEIAKNAFKGALRSMPVWLRASKVLSIERKAVLWFDDEGYLVPPPEDADERLALAAKRPVQAFDSPPYPQTLRRDLTVETPEGKIREIDWKTAWATGHSGRESKAMGFYGNFQFTALDIFARAAYGPKYDGVWAALVGKASPHQMSLIDASPTAVARSRLGVTVAHQERTLADLIRRTPNAASWPAVLSEQGPCLDRYGVCPFYQACRGGTP